MMLAALLVGVAGATSAQERPSPTLRDLLVTVNVVFDFVTPRTGAPARPITPYLVAGAGIFSHS